MIKKQFLLFVAALTIAVLMPTVAKAQTVVTVDIEEGKEWHVGDCWARYSQGVLYIAAYPNTNLDNPNILHPMPDFSSFGAAPWHSYHRYIKEVVVREGVTAIGNYAFTALSMTKITLPSTLKRIGDCAFQASHISSVTLPDGLTTIGENAFDACMFMSSLTVPASVTNIGSQCFRFCSINELYLSSDPATLTLGDNLGEKIYCIVPMLYYNGYVSKFTNQDEKFWFSSRPINCGGNCWATMYGSELVINGTGAMPDFASAEETTWHPLADQFTSIKIDGNITHIGNNAFAECVNVSSLTLDTYGYLESIGDNAFEGMTQLTSLNLPFSLTTIGNSAFKDCSGLTTITMRNRVASIGQNAFQGCTSVNDVFIRSNPEGLTWNGSNDFKSGGATNCYVPSNYLDTYNSSLGSQVNVTFQSYAPSWNCGMDGDNCVATLDNGVMTVEGTGAMADYSESAPWNEYLSDITSIVIAEGVTYVGRNAFSWAANVESISLPSTLTSIRDYAFAGCKITSLVIPEGVTSISNGTFQNCGQLTTVTLPSTLTTEGGAFSWCSAVTDIYLYADPSALRWGENSSGLKENKGTFIHVLPEYLEAYQNKLDVNENAINATFVGDLAPLPDPTSKLTNIPSGWTVAANGSPVAVTNGEADVVVGASVVLTPTEADKIEIKLNSTESTSTWDASYLSALEVEKGWNGHETAVKDDVTIRCTSGYLYQGGFKGTSIFTPATGIFTGMQIHYTSYEGSELQIDGMTVNAQAQTITWSGAAVSLTLSVPEKLTIDNIEFTLFDGYEQNADGTWSFMMPKSTKEINLTYKTDNGILFLVNEANATLGLDFAAPELFTAGAFDITYSSSAPTVATIDATTGALTLLQAGTTVITATFAGNDDYVPATASYTLHVNEPCVLTIDNADPTRGTLSVETSSNVKASDTEGAYTVETGALVTLVATPAEGYSTKGVNARVYTSWGTAGAPRRTPRLLDEITLTPQEGDKWTFTMPEYNVYATATFAKILQDAWIQAIDDQAYAEGEAIEPAVVLKDGSTTLVEGTDYTVTYTNNTEKGTATVTVNAVEGSDYSGSAQATFTILKYITPTIVVGEAGPGGVPEVVVKDGNDVLEEGTDYTLYYTDTNDNTVTIEQMEEQQGEFIAVVTLQGFYRGTATQSFIVKATVVTTLAMPAGQYATFYSDQGLNLAEETAEGVMLCTVSNITNKQVTLKTLTSAAAETPLIIYNGTDSEQTVTLKVNEEAETVDYAPEFKGTLVERAMPSSGNGTDYYLLSGGKDFVWVYGEGVIGANKCWIEISSNVTAGARTLAIGFDDDVTTGIKPIDNTLLANDNWFNLSGCHIKKPTKKGIYVQNGTKVVVK